MWTRSRTSRGHSRETLGDDYEAIAAESQPGRRRRNLVGVPPNELIRRRYVEKADIVTYGPHPRVNFADVWRRRDLPRDGKAPVLLQVPGGAWSIGMRRPQAYPLLSHLAERGWVCVSIDYRVSPRHTWPDHIVDVKRALAWIKEHIAEYGGDPDFVAITGGSAGGHLCALAALTPDDPQYQPGFEDADTSVVAAVPIYGRYDWFSTKGPGRWEFVLILLQRLVVKKRLTKHLQVYRDASPITRVRPDAPPFFVLHGDDDSLIPVPEAREFVAALRDVSKEHRRLLRDPACPARVRLLRVAARPLHRASRREVPVVGARHPKREVATAPSPSRSPSAPRKARRRGGFRRMPRSSRRSARAGPDSVAPSDSTEMFSWST